MLRITKRRLLRATVESIEHWKRMMVWVALNTHWDAEPDAQQMFDAIGEHWAGIYCSLCNLWGKGGCNKACPIFKCDEEYSGVWRRVAMSATWGQWLSAAKVMLDLLKSTEKKLRKEIADGKRKRKRKILQKRGR